MPINITIDSSSTTNGSDNFSSYSDDSSSTGVQVSPDSGLGSPEYADSLDGSDSWFLLHPDHIRPSESASRPRTSNQHRTPAATIPHVRPPPAPHRQSSRRANERLVRHPPRTHRPVPPIAPESVDDPSEDYPGYARGHPPPHSRAHAHWRVPEAPVPYPSSYASSHPYETYAGNSIVPVGGQQLMPVPAQGGYGYHPNPYPPGHSAAAAGYFQAPHHHGVPPIGPPVSPRPTHAQPHSHGHSLAHVPAPSHSPAYASPDMLGYGPGPGYYYGPQAYGMPSAVSPHLFYPPYHVVPSPPKQPTPPPPPDTSKDDEKFARLEQLLLDQKREADEKEARAQKAAEEREAAAKRAAEEIAAAKLKADAEAAAAAMAVAEAAREEAKAQAEKAKAEAEAAKAEVEATKADLAAKLAEEAAKSAAAIKEAEDAAKAAAEVAAAEAEAKKKEAAEAAAAEAKAAAEAAAAAEKAAALAEAEAAKKPKPEKKKPIKFKDALGRKFSFPFHLCQSWAGMEELIRQAFVHVDVIGPHVAEGHYDLIGPNGDIILPQVWETVVEPDWVITMKMWPIPEPPPPPPEPAKEPEKAEEKAEEKAAPAPEPEKTEPQPEQVVVVGPGKAPKVEKVAKKAKAAAAPAPVPPPPPPAPGEAGDSTVAPSPAAVVAGGSGGGAKKAGQVKISPFLMWTAGGRARNSKKAEKKPEEGTQTDVVCRVM